LKQSRIYVVIIECEGLALRNIIHDLRKMRILSLKTLGVQVRLLPEAHQSVSLLAKLDVGL